VLAQLVDQQGGQRHHPDAVVLRWPLLEDSAALDEAPVNEGQPFIEIEIPATESDQLALSHASLCRPVRATQSSSSSQIGGDCGCCRAAADRH
jgi:hypothetical protein